MKPLRCWLLLGMAAVSNASVPDSRAHITVLLYNYSGVSELEVKKAIRYTSRIFGRIGTSMNWVNCRPVGGSTHIPSACGEARGRDKWELRLLPRCIGNYPGVGPSALGVTLYPKEGGRGILANVFVDRAAELTRAGDIGLAVVLGHVMAHELGHLLLGFGRHSSRGLMREAWRDEDLRWASRGLLNFLPQEGQSIRDGIRRNSPSGRLEAGWLPATPDAMSLTTPRVLAAEVVPGFSREFYTAKYRITMRVSFPAPYEGKRLVVYRSTGPEEGDCVSSAHSGCNERFVGAVAVVLFTVNRTADGRPAPASIREVVTVVDQSPGLPERPPFAMSIKLANGIGSDFQAFGYDEGPMQPAERATARELAQAAWRRYRQSLYMDKDQEPFAVVEWLHTTTRIRIVRVDTAASVRAQE